MTRRPPRIIFNSDGDIHFAGLRSVRDLDGFCRGIDELAGPLRITGIEAMV